MKRQDIYTLIEVATISSIYKTKSEISNDLKSIGFELLLKTHKASGYDAVVCRSQQTNDIVLFHMGTDYVIKEVVTGINDVNGLVNVLTTDIVNDFYIFLYKQLPQIADAINTLNSVLSEYSGSKIIQIGYSLGGFLAQICYASSTQKIDTLILDFPGASEVIQKYYPDIKVEERGNLEYYSRPSGFINSYGTRILADSHPINIIHPYSMATEDALFKTEIVFGTKFLDYLAYSLAVHDIINFNKDFNKNDSFEQVTNNWPSSIMDGFQHHLSQNNKLYWEMLVTTKIYPEVCKKLQQPESADLLNKVIQFFDDRYLTTNPDEFNWTLYNANINTISDEYYAYTQQVMKYSILSKTAEFFCLSCCCCVYVPFKILKVGYNYVADKTNKVRTSLNDDINENQKLIEIPPSKQIHPDTIICITDEIQDKYSECRSYLLNMTKDTSNNNITDSTYDERVINKIQDKYTECMSYLLDMAEDTSNNTITGSTYHEPWELV